MREFNVVFRSFADVQEFVRLVSEFPFDVFVSNDWQRVDAKSFMVMFSLDFSRQLRVMTQCGQEEFTALKNTVARFLV